MDEGDGEFGDGGDRNEDQFLHRNEAISAVADEGFLGEEYDDYEDLYNDVNVGEGFLQTLRRNQEEDLGFRTQEEEVEVDKKIDVSAAESTGVSVPGVSGEAKVEKGGDGSVVASRVPARVEGYQDLGFRGNEMASKGSGGGGGGGGGGGIKVELGPSSSSCKMGETRGHIDSNSSVPSQGIGQPQQQQQQHSQVVGSGNVGHDGFGRQGGIGGVGGNVNGIGGSGNASGGASGGGGTILFVGDLHWWTTDAQLEAELTKYGPVKEVKFFDEKASGKSKGYCQVEFYDPASATACKEGMNGHIFNGRPCVVAYASPYSVRRMGEAQVNKNQQMAQTSLSQGRRTVGDAGGRGGGNSIATGGNYQGGDGGRGYGRGNWGRGGAQGVGGRGQVGPMRGRIGGGMGGRGIIGNGGSGFGQGLAATPPLLHPQTMMGQGFDPSYGAQMGRMAGYGGFPAGPTPPFSGILPSFPPVGGVGLPGVAPHVNPAFFGRGMPANGMGMMPTTGVEGHGMGMWSDPSAAAWGSDEHAGRAGESSYGEDAASDHQYGEVSHERGGWSNATKEKERAPEREWSGASDRRYRDDRETMADRDMSREKDIAHAHDWPERRHREDRETVRDRDRDRDRDRHRDRDRERDRDRDRERDRDRYREDRDRYLDHHRYRERESEQDDEWDRGRSRTHSKLRLSQDEDRRSGSRDAEYAKRRRPSE
ncbi:PREDICTED: cleavage and polyadenylation specificity factor subunit CG7185 [Nelumbo nucifera]|uniref:Cleavage and polyadenylation specificity factor subunit CG7185 n=1 Tax=Nelumbo nucifera TaxID=4432 RepID=A0A1U8B3G7_NELNU|nr:PREDICTED: cleavage and polyadenylation specificity factor subunit CG7185 [Nelumbo nucifera]